MSGLKIHRYEYVDLKLWVAVTRQKSVDITKPNTRYYQITVIIRIYSFQNTYIHHI